VRRFSASPLLCPALKRLTTNLTLRLYPALKRLTTSSRNTRREAVHDRSRQRF
jgi:hypothetical protein